MSNFLSEVQLNRLVPSVFATGGSSMVSDKYGFIPTIDCIKGLEDAGFLPISASQSKTRLPDRKDFVRHMIRMRHKDCDQINGMYPEVVLINSHDGSTSYQLRAGIYRLICSNGLIVGSERFCRRIKHQGNVVDKVVDAAKDLLEIFPESIQIANKWETIDITPQQKIAFAESASLLKWEADKVAIHPNSLLIPRRNADTKENLFTTFNVVQENLIQGGIRYRNENGMRQRTRGVNSVSENTRLNTALWTLTEKMAELIK